MEMDRRRALHLIGSGLVLSAAPSALSASSTAATSGLPKVALLLPVTGASAELGLSMHRSTRLAQSAAEGKTAFTLFDTGDSAEGAGNAAAQAVAEGAAFILGPLFGRQIPAVAAAVGGRVPVISFSNDSAPPRPSVFTFGITPSQSVSAVLQYARGRGVRRVAVIGAGTPWSEQSRAAAQRLATEIGLQLIDAPGSNTIEALQAMGLPDAALLTGGPQQIAALAPDLETSGVQVLATLSAFDRSAAGRAALEGVWLSAPDPASLERFAQASTSPGGSTPGLIAALAYDAARIAEDLTTDGTLNASDLLRPAGFEGVGGAVRFMPDGRCVRELTILVCTSGTFRDVGRRVGL